MRKTRSTDLCVACPKCKAWGGVLCRSTGGHGELTGVVHRERRQAAEAKLERIRAEMRTQGYAV